MLPVHGYCDLRFGAVLDAFRETFATQHDVGAAVAAVVDGKLVVDLWAGHADAAGQRPWSRNTLVQVDEVTRTLTALCLLMLAEGGIVELDAPIARYWPEFGDHGKVPITVRHALTHRAGLPGLREPLAPDDLLDGEGMTRRLAAETPWWPAGAEVGDHARTDGYLLGEVVRRVSGRTVGAFFQDEIGGPLGLDVHIGGLGPDQDHRIADVILPAVTADDAIDRDPSSLQFAVARNPATLPDQNGRAWRQAEVPSLNGHATARGLARLMAALARGGELDGVRILTARTLAQATREQVQATEIVFARPLRLGTGFLLAAPSYPFGSGPRTFGAVGSGGAVAFADPDADVGFAYTANRMRRATGEDARDPRSVALVDALFDVL